MNDTQSERGTLEEQIQTLVHQMEDGAGEGYVLSLLAQLLFEQSTTLRSFEAILIDSQERIRALEDRRASTADRPRSIVARIESPSVVKGKRRTDQCSFCGRNASESEAVYSSPNGAHICTGCIDTFNALRS